ncbi:MAG: GNAT family N-acetyltransferase [Anaerolineaceae bacterium]|nr:GNAT family N-acetyltransferase [Anaerolineae bacterium]MCB9460806.1 GNAT family N-acetyltransferase [Anaerolineaceae bacterium]
MTEPFLALPSTQYKSSFIDAVHEFIKEDRWRGWKPSLLRSEFESYVENVLLMETDPPAGFVPQTTYWMIADDQYVGRTSIRHHLNASLETFGGHIGYEVRPSMRRMGYGTLMCRLVIVEARKLGIDRILITCDDDNIGSQKIIEANGGILQDKVDNGRPALTRRYWIEAPE